MPFMKRGFVADRMKQELLAGIESGTLAPGDPILSIAKLASRYRLATGTVVSAIKDLEAQGYLESVQGKGTFVAAGARNLTSTPALAQIGLSYPFALATDAFWQRLQEEVLRRNALLTTYNVGEDRQDPAMELRFLERCKQAGCKGVALFASPREPLNTEHYHRMRREGMKVALIAPHQYNVNDEVVFMGDHRAAGAEAVRHARRLGCERIVFVEGAGRPPVFSTWTREGAYNAAEELGCTIEEPVKLRSHRRPSAEADVPTPRREERQAKRVAEANAELLPRLRALPEGTVLIAPKTIYAVTAYLLLQQAGRVPGGELRLCSCFHPPLEGYEGIGGFDFPRTPWFAEVIEYLLDDDIRPDLRVHHWIKPVYRAGETF